MLPNKEKGFMTFSRKTGESQWTFTAGGRIDSPPAFYRGLLIFGSRDGWVYSLRADTGELAWKFCDLPDRRLMAAHGQLESVWPVHGAVLIRDGVRSVRTCSSVFRIARTACGTPGLGVTWAR